LVAFVPLSAIRLRLQLDFGLRFVECVESEDTGFWYSWDFMDKIFVDGG
jgi:hypothetical protein